MREVFIGREQTTPADTQQRNEGTQIMANHSKAAVQSYALENEALLAERIDSERAGFDRMTAKQQETCNDTCADLRRWYGECSDHASQALMLKCGVDFGFLSTKGLSGKYNVEKVFKLAPYMAGVTGKLNTHDWLVFRTLYNFTKAGVKATRDHLKAAIDHNKAPSHDELVFRGKRFGTGTSAPQHGSSLANFNVWHMLKCETCRDTGAEVFSLDLDAPATKAMVARLTLA